MTPGHDVIPQTRGETRTPTAVKGGADTRVSPPAVAPALTDRAALDAALLAAHAAHDGPRLVHLYTVAGDRAESGGDIDAACFYLTHAYVYALEAGAPEADLLHARLLAHGREE